MKKRGLAVASILVVAAYLRIPHLAERPMHADEAILAQKLGILLETGKWTYDPGEYHGPVLHYLGATSARLAGARSYIDLTENQLRVVSALLGMIVVLLPLLLAGKLGWPQTLAASALTAISPAMVYYSRYYIPEMLLVCLSGLLIAAGQRYIISGVLIGLMFSTKETAVIAAACLVLAILLAPPERQRNWRNLLIALAIAVVVAIALLGFRETVQSMAVYASRAVQGGSHIHPWYYYLRLLFWSEISIVVLAGLAISVSGFARFLVVYTLALLAVYSLIPYKTPWCLLGFLQGFILLGGVGVVHLARRFRRVAIVLAGAFWIQLGVQAYMISRPYSADRRNPYAYAHTSRDVFAIRDRLETLGRSVTIQVISSQNVWPLPWYLRSFSNVDWRRGVSPEMRPAPVILATPEIEPALLHHLYEAPPPGQRLLYGNLFPDYTELRPGVELRGYAQQSLLADTAYPRN